MVVQPTVVQPKVVHPTMVSVPVESMPREAQDLQTHAPDVETPHAMHARERSGLCRDLTEYEPRVDRRRSARKLATPNEGAAQDKADGPIWLGGSYNGGW